ncbi:MAG: hypothetical protein UX79_C0015G0002 [candidate division WWE3 bacterium GW2011_GWB1_47_11]|uniref:HTH merR-type domain-containing protein n=1 Tax=candidate division WWE3 bacterium GW2011_GWB1_47_11 TaxID=1619117 RepID=A0A0G1RJ03_UNCKA|nr:MAG: hypothetical protein UX79_C0015G0002 [candidate division WWE3 bacterium GW2011_GWB1_47_11]
MLGVSPTTLRRFETEGKITSQRADNGYRFFKLDDVRKLKEQIQSEKEQKPVGTPPFRVFAEYREPCRTKVQQKTTLQGAALQELTEALPNIRKTTKTAAIGSLGLFIILALTSFGILDGFDNLPNKLGVSSKNMPDVLAAAVVGRDDLVLKISTPVEMAQNLTVPSISGVNVIDPTTKATLENTLELAGDATGTLNNVQIEQNVIGDDELADDIES